MTIDCTESGYKLDDNGCRICECYRDPCPTSKCVACGDREYYKYYNFGGDICRACGCESSVQCPPLPCECPEGYKRRSEDINGCPSCTFGCVRDEPRCPELSCDLNCNETGYKMDMTTGAERANVTGTHVRCSSAYPAQNTTTMR